MTDSKLAHMRELLRSRRLCCDIIYVVFYVQCPMRNAYTLTTYVASNIKFHMNDYLKMLSKETTAF